MTATVKDLLPNTNYSFTIEVKDQSDNVSDDIKTISFTTLDEVGNTSCFGESDIATQGTITTGYTYSFETNGSDVIIEFELLDQKQIYWLTCGEKALFKRHP